MKLDRTGGPFQIVGENIHATRVLKRTGKHAVELDGRLGRHRVRDARRRARSSARSTRTSPRRRDFAAGKIKHVQSAVRWGLDGGAAGRHGGRATSGPWPVARRSTGADWLDLNVDEVSADSGMRAAGHGLAGRDGRGGPPPFPCRSTRPTWRCSRRASRPPAQPRGRLMLNSASIERPEVLDIAADGSAARSSWRPAARAACRPTPRSGSPTPSRLIEAAVARGIAPDLFYVDPLVLPVAVSPDAPAHVLEAARRLRGEYGDAIHLTGGLSNVSFGMPARKLLNDTFIDLCAEAGIDSGIIDPVASDLARVFSADRDTEGYKLAADMLLGRDPFGGEYVAAFREGRLGAE